MPVFDVGRITKYGSESGLPVPPDEAIEQAATELANRGLLLVNASTSGRTWFGLPRLRHAEGPGRPAVGRIVPWSEVRAVDDMLGPGEGS
jgi:hypothetical protein